MTETSRHVPVFYCPYCGEEDIRPHDGGHGQWLCTGCRRVWAVRFLGLVGAGGSAGAAGAAESGAAESGPAESTAAVEAVGTARAAATAGAAANPGGTR